MTGGQALIRPLRAEVVKVVFADSSFQEEFPGQYTHFLFLSFCHPPFLRRKLAAVS